MSTTHTPVQVNRVAQKPAANEKESRRASAQRSPKTSTIAASKVRPVYKAP